MYSDFLSDRTHFSSTPSFASHPAVGLTARWTCTGQSEPILVGGENLLKPAFRLISQYRLRIEPVQCALLRLRSPGQGWKGGRGDVR